MPAISYKKFSGEIPREQPHLLPDTCAQLALNVDVVDGSMSPLRDGLLLRSMLSNPVKGIFTLDGLNFYTWSVETLAFRSPIIDDSQNRFYFLQPSAGVFNVGRTLQMAYNGPIPTSNVYRAGVPKAVVAPTLSLIELTEFPDYPAATVSGEAWWELQGKSYGRTAVSLFQQQRLRRYTFTPPAKPQDTPDGVKLSLYFKFSDNAGAEIASFTLRSGEASKSAAIPGTVEATLTDGSPALVTFTYGAMEARAYTYTYENQWGEEGGPANPAIISPTYLQSVRILPTIESFSGFIPMAKVNIYRTYGSNSTYLKSKVTDSTGGSYIDSKTKPDDVGIALESTDWLPSPTGLAGIDLTPNGWFVAFRGNMIHMSEPYRPHAWPYSIPTPTAVRGVRVAQGNVVVTTADGLYVINGAFPSNAQLMKLTLPQPGIAQRSMVNVDGGVAYASNDGIAIVEGSSSSMAAGAKLFTRKVWRERYDVALSDASMMFGYHDGCLVMSSKTIGSGFLIRLDEDIGEFTRTTFSYDAMFLLPVTDTLYYSIGSNIYRFNSGDALEADWIGKDFIFPNPVTFGAGRIICTGPMRVRLYANGQAVYDETLSTGYFRLPNILKQIRWAVRLTGSNTVSDFAIARSMLELRNV